MIYQGKTIVFATMHGKERQVARFFQTGLGAQVVVPKNFDTDRFGTFSGEVERPDNMIVTAAKKCAAGMQLEDAAFGLASEGSFGPHPLLPFMTAAREVFYFIDHESGFETYEHQLFELTNFAHQIISKREELDEFLNRALFPSHAVILRPHSSPDRSLIAKGIRNYEAALTAFERFRQDSEDGQVWIESDMRAHLNPSRQKTLRRLAKNLVRRLAAPCPACGLPGWGRVDVESGLPCGLCGQPTDSIKSDIWGCVKCDHKESYPREQGEADPMYCGFCNP